VYCCIGGTTAADIVQEVAAGAKAIIAWGNCACSGCVQAAKPNPTSATPINKIITGKPIVNVQGCPPIAEVMAGVLVHLLTFDRIPQLDALGRPKAFYSRRVHDTCYRRPNYDAGLFVESFDDENARKGYCLYKVGCKGPTTYNSCGTIRWNGGVSFPIQSGHGCIGCSESNFWDNGPFYRAPLGLPGLRHRDHRRQDRAGRRRRHVAGAAGHAVLTNIRKHHEIGEQPGESAAEAPPTPPAIIQRERREIIMNSRIVVDPITRIEGHLRIEAEVKDGFITDAWSAGTMVRGLEIILKGRDPRDAWAFCERVCGVCTTVHALASVRSVEDALGIAVPPNAELIRNLMFCVQYMQDHVVHFYHLHALDWVDVVSALKADPAEASRIAQSISHWPKSSPGYFSDLQKRLTKFVESGQLGIFANGYWGHPAYKLPPAVNLIGVAHYLEALEWQKEIVKVHTIFGGKNPHPNYLVGGVPCSINIDEANAINAERLAMVGRLLEQAKVFVEQVYIPDLLAIAPSYLDWAGDRRRREELPQLRRPADQRLRRRRPLQVPARHHPRPRPVPRARGGPEGSRRVQEFIDHSWYDYQGGQAGLHPWDGETNLKYTGPKPPYEHLDVAGKYSWLKTPALEGSRHGGGPALAHARRLRRRQRRDQGRRHRDPRGPQGPAGRPLLDARAHRRPRHRDEARRALGARVLRPAPHQHQERRLAHVHEGEVGAVHLAAQARGVGPTEAPARRPRALDRDRGQEDRELPARGAEHLERLAPRCQGPALAL
jgi:Ni,Fe-hydrogenase I large subunit